MEKNRLSSFELINIYRDYIDASNSIFRLDTFEPAAIKEIYLTIKNTLIKKYEISIIRILEIIDYACAYRDRYLEAYLQLIQNFLQDVESPDFNPFRYTLNIEKLMIYIKDSPYYQFFSKFYQKPHKFDQNHSHNKGSFLNCIMNDDIQSFITRVENDEKLLNFRWRHDLIGNLTVMEWCSYYGSEKIFMYILNETKSDISDQCGQLSFLGGNPTIVNQSLKDVDPSDLSMEYAVISHNSDFIVYLQNENCKINPKFCLQSSNLFGLILYHEQSKNHNEFYVDLTYFGLNLMFTDYEFQQEMVSVKNCEGKTVLHYFTIANNVILLQTMIDLNIDINAKDDFNWSALHYATKYNCIDAVNILLDNKAIVNIEDGDRFRPLHKAAEYNNTEILSILIDHGASIHDKNNYLEIPLHCAVRSNSIESVAILLDNGSDVNSTNLPLATPLELAVDFDLVDIATLLIDFGADANATNKFQRTSLIFQAVMNNSINMLDLLVDNGADINALRNDLSTPLHLAAEYNSTECAIDLVQKGANIEAKQCQGITPLCIAVSKSRETAIALIELGADVNAVGAGQCPILNIACSCALKDIAPLLISKGADVNATDPSNNNAIHAAAAANNVEAISCLLEHGVDINILGYKLLTPLYMAVMHGAYDATKFLLEHSADINIRYNTFTVLHMAITINAKLPIVDLLIAFGADIQSRTGDGETVLHLAARYNKPKLVPYLLEKGADINIKDDDNLTPLDTARVYKAK
ncbi:ankyrin repeat protein, putative [Trichomonas vaginalis G3]|uniref:Ankyrin repeat protein, putative n=1 Tax=Trichomonas vaginalis (strain ATCC PRA-98 / G3) TaxID=412133 RepID=A2FV55_TRIV3|nr:spectrin binding [Trichomonas vaginalis G3]EAX91220.1 ankyrin repeat protein, putative [Trichomonas vaginalis G3]KAI5501980.1 spectrin binding [Trichomonas vaginalis G3]|eukprot:XP_001304150.1 ankyrin repeat protein [Trichomonas vaginalis G3]